MHPCHVQLVCHLISRLFCWKPIPTCLLGANWAGTQTKDTLSGLSMVTEIIIDQYNMSILSITPQHARLMRHWDNSIDTFIDMCCGFSGGGGGDLLVT